MAKNTAKFRKMAWIFLALALVMGNTMGCSFLGIGGDKQVTPQPIPIDQNDPGVVVEVEGPIYEGEGGDQSGLIIRLSDGQAVPSVIDQLIPVRGEALTEEEIQAISLQYLRLGIRLRFRIGGLVMMVFTFLQCVVYFAHNPFTCFLGQIGVLN